MTGGLQHRSGKARPGRGKGLTSDPVVTEGESGNVVALDCGKETAGVRNVIGRRSRRRRWRIGS